MTKYLVFFLKYYPNCFSILYKSAVEYSFYKHENIFTIVSDFVLCPRETFFPIFYKRTMPYNKRLTGWPQPFGQYGKISNLGVAVLTSQSLGQYSKTSVGYFPVQPSLSVSKLLISRSIQQDEDL